MGEGGSSAGVICGVVAVGVVAVAVVSIAALVDSYHTIEQGNVGIYFKYGALMDEVTEPGVHWKQAWVTEVELIKIRPHTDTLPAIVSVTKDGIENVFRGIQVISKVRETNVIKMVKKFGRRFKETLVFDRIKEELRIFCANKTIHEVYNEQFLEIVEAVTNNVKTSISRLGENGIIIMNLVIPKPEIPDDIAANYKQVKVQWTEQLVAAQQQKTERIKKETESIKALADARRQKAVLQIKIEEKILDKQGEETISNINNNITRAKEENIANIEKYKIEKQAEANRELYTPEFVKLNMAKALASNTKFYFSGQESVLGGLINEFLGKSR